MDIHSVFGILDYRHSFLSSPINIASISELYNDMLDFNPLMFRAAKYPEDIDLLLAEPTKTLVFRKPPFDYLGKVRRFELSSFLSMALFLNRVEGFDRVIEICGSDDDVVKDLLNSGCELLFDATAAVRDELFSEQKNEGKSYWSGFRTTFSPSEFRIPEKTPFHITKSIEYAADLSEDREQVILASKIWSTFSLYTGSSIRSVERWLSMVTCSSQYPAFANRIEVFLAVVEDVLSSREKREIQQIKELLKDEPNIFTLCPDLPISPNIAQKLPETAFMLSNKFAVCNKIIQHAVKNAPQDSREEAAVILNDYKSDYSDATIMKSFSEILGIPGMFTAFNAGVPINDICV